MEGLSTSPFSCYTSNMNKFTIVARPDEISKGLEKKIETELTQHGLVRDDVHPKTVIVVGGDGTFIYAVHKFIDQLQDVRFFGLHRGTLGFYSDYRDCELDDFLDVLIQDNGKEDVLSVLRAEVDGKRYYGLNEIRIENVARTQVLNVMINDVELETFRGTGMCVCTQLGSTAYNRSLGGAIIQEGLDLIEMAEISGIHHSKYRSLSAPIVLKSDSVIRFESESFDGAVLGVDSDVYPLEKDTTSIEIKICSQRQIKVLRGKKISYFDRLKMLY